MAKQMTQQKKSRLINKQNNSRYVFQAYLGWSLKHVAQNYLFISISFYRNMVCQNVSCKQSLG